MESNRIDEEDEELPQGAEEDKVWRVWAKYRSFATNFYNSDYL
jgi:hypothetical protein